MPVDLLTLLQTPLSKCSFSAPPQPYTTLQDFPPIKKDFFLQKTPKLQLGETEKALQLQSKQFELGGSDFYPYIAKRALITGDVVKYAHDEIVAPMEAAFCSLGPAFWRVSSMVPVPPQSDANLAACRIEFVFGGQQGGAYALLSILSPRSIKPHEWTGTMNRLPPSTLGPLIRRQAHQMRCPQVLMFDGTTLLRVGFGDINHMDVTDQINAGVVCEDHTALWDDRGPVRGSTDCTVREVVYATILKGLRRRAIEEFSLQTSFDILLIHAACGDGSLWDFGSIEGVLERTEHMVLRKVAGEVCLPQCVDDRRPFRMAWVSLTHGNVNEMPLVGPF